MYNKFFKRFFDFISSLAAIIILFPLLFVLTLIGWVAMKGNPFFVQPRPGKKDKNGTEKIFYLIKFRTMSNAKDKEGNLLPDDVRLNAYGKFLRSTSLDELPELLNILKGDMAVVGPRPQLVRDMVFMSEEQRHRHDVRPGLTGLAQVNGRNEINWGTKLELDLLYISKITFVDDIKIFLKTFIAVTKREGIAESGVLTATDFGDYLLLSKKISKDFYDLKQKEALSYLSKTEGKIQ